MTARANKARKRAMDRATVGTALLKMVDDAVLFGLPPIDAVHCIQHVLASTIARYYGASGAPLSKPYGEALPVLVAQYAEVMSAKKSPIILGPDGAPIVAQEPETKPH